MYFETSMGITIAQLQTFVGKDIRRICANGYAAPHDNHCAHFVSHAMGYGFGYTCQAATSGKSPGANLRVHELFSHCSSVGRWADKPIALNSCLVFVTAASHVDVTRKIMANVPQKHVGIFRDGTIWHYSNAHQRVVTQPPGEFVHHYHGSGIELFYGQFPQ